MTKCLILNLCRGVTVAIEQRWLHSSLERFAASIGFLAVNPLRTFAAGNGYYNHDDNLANFSLKWKKIALSAQSINKGKIKHCVLYYEWPAECRWPFILTPIHTNIRLSLNKTLCINTI